MSDVFVDHDLLPATTSHAALSAEVARLRSRIEQLQKYLERCSHKRNEIGGALDAEREMHERTRVVVARRDVMIDDLCSALQEILDLPIGEFDDGAMSPLMCWRCDDRNDIAVTALAKIRKSGIDE